MEVAVEETKQECKIIVDVISSEPTHGCQGDTEYPGMSECETASAKSIRCT